MKLFLLSTSAILFTNSVYAAQDYTATKVFVQSSEAEDSPSLDELSDNAVFIEEESQRASCKSRNTRDWCTNDFQPSSGDCEWNGSTRNGSCRTAPTSDDRASCSSRTTRDWCTNDFQPSSGDCEWTGSTRNGSCRTAGRFCRNDSQCRNRNDFCNKDRNRCERATGTSCKSG